MSVAPRRRPPADAPEPAQAVEKTGPRKLNHLANAVEGNELQPAVKGNELQPAVEGIGLLLPYRCILRNPVTEGVSENNRYKG